MSSINRLVLVLNASYEPINIRSARRTIKLVLKGAAAVEQVWAYTVGPSKIDIPENLVACRFACNNRKGSRTPQEAGMALAPRQITIHARHRLLPGDEETWERYLFC